MLSVITLRLRIYTNIFTSSEKIGLDTGGGGGGGALRREVESQAISICRFWAWNFTFFPQDTGKYYTTVAQLIKKIKNPHLELPCDALWLCWIPLASRGGSVWCGRFLAALWHRGENYVFFFFFSTKPTLHILSVAYMRTRESLPNMRECAIILSYWGVLDAKAA